MIPDHDGRLDHRPATRPRLRHPAVRRPGRAAAVTRSGPRPARAPRPASPAPLHVKPEPLTAAAEVAGLNFGVWAFLHYFGNSYYSYIRWERDPRQYPRRMGVGPQHLLHQLLSSPTTRLPILQRRPGQRARLLGLVPRRPRRQLHVGDDDEIMAEHQQSDRDNRRRDRLRRDRLPLLRAGPQERRPRPRCAPGARPSGPSSTRSAGPTGSSTGATTAIPGLPGSPDAGRILNGELILTGPVDARNPRSRAPGPRPSSASR